jgi:hypothetical protein
VYSGKKGFIAGASVKLRAAMVPDLWEFLDLNVIADGEQAALAMTIRSQVA